MVELNYSSKEYLDDGKYNSINPKTKFPNYICNNDHPFLTIHYESTTGSNIIEWMHTDSKDLYLSNLKTMPFNWRYRTKKVEYHLNSSGYRTHEWNKIDWKNAIVLLGCSNTFGIGLDEEETYATMLEHDTGRQVVNLGIPAGSTAAILANCSTLVSRYGIPYAVIINWPPLTRLRYYTQHTFYEVGHWTNEGNKANNADLFSIYFNMFADDTNTLVYNYYISQAASAMFNDRTKYITFSYIEESAHYMRADTYIQMYQTAREGIHPGVETSQETTKYLLSRLK